MCHSFLIHSFADGHLSCFQYLAFVNCAAMNIGVHRFFRIGVSGLLGYNPISGIAGSKAVPFLIFEVPPYCFPQWLHQSAFPPTRHRILYLLPLDALCIYNLCHLAFQCQLAKWAEFSAPSQWHWVWSSACFEWWNTGKSNSVPVPTEADEAWMFLHEHGVISWAFMTTYEEVPL